MQIDITFPSEMGATKAIDLLKRYNVAGLDRLAPSFAKDI